MGARGQAERMVLHHLDTSRSGRSIGLPHRFRFLALIVVLLLPCTSPGQSSPAPAQNATAPAAQAQAASTAGAQTESPAPASSAKSNPSDFSAEAYVILFAKSSTAFQADGSYVDETTLRAKTQSAAGVQALGVISAPYASATSTMQVVYVRVTKADGTVVTTPPDNVLDMPAAITQQAPFYSDLKVQQVAVKGLAVGDTLEYQFRETSTKPIDPGQFWYDLNFLKSAVALDQEAEISVPAGHYLKIQSPDSQPTMQQQNGRTIYTWKTSHLQGTGDDKDQAVTTPQEPTIQISTFRNWAEVGAWFNGLAAPQAVPTPDVKAKALELTKDSKTDQERIEALYDFVSTKYRYIGIDFGIGRYQPHTASEVLANDYGDCKDKHTLLAALLAAVGIKAYPALISTGLDVDSEIPSPAQFDHVITAVPQSQGYLFLDTTPEVGPFGYLIAALRDKKALVVSSQGGAALVKTPADPPFPSIFSFQSDGTLTDAGKYDGKMHMSIRGDAELLFRLAFRQVGESQWNTAVQSISSGMGFGGTTSDASILKLDDTRSPLEVNYSYTREKVGDWDNKQLTAPLPPVDIDGAPDESVKNPQPVKVGSPMTEDLLATVKLPEDANPTLPETVSLHNDFADYDATYSLSGGVLTIERKFSTKAREIPVDQFDAYRKFVKSVTDDESRLIPVYRSTNALYRSSNTQAQALYDKGTKANSENDTQAALDDFQQAVTKDPNFAQAWLMLGYLHMRTDRATGTMEMEKAAALAAPEATIAKYVANYLQMMRSPEESLKVWKDIEKKNPNDTDAAVHIGAVLFQQQHYSEALPELQNAAKLNPSNANTELELGESYLATGDKTQGLAAIQKAVALDGSAATLNSAAYDLADENLDLDDALKFAKEAVKEAELASNSISIQKLSPKDQQSARDLSRDWDTLGWVYFRRGDFDNAVDYLNAAWHITFDPLIAYHLGQVYEKQGRTHDAVVAYREAVDGTLYGQAPQTKIDAQHRLDDLRPDGHFQSNERVSPADMQKMRTFDLPHIYSGSANASFYVLLGPGGKVIQATFFDGYEVLHEKGEAALKTIKFDAPIPKGSSAQILHSGILNCESVVPRCTFVLLPPELVATTQ